MKFISIIFTLLIISVNWSCSNTDSKTTEFQLNTNNDYGFYVIENDSIKIHRDAKIIAQLGDSINGQITIKSKYDSKTIIYFEKGWKTKKDYYHNDSLITSQYHYSKKKLDGKYFERYDNGNLKIRGQYKLGKADSLWEFYYQNGQIQAQGYFNSKHDTGEIEFIEHYFDNSVGLETEVSYTSNNYAFDGTWTFYDLSGKIVQQLKFAKGRITSFHIGKPDI